MNINNYDFVKSKYGGVLEIYPTKCTNTIILNKVLREIEKDYTLVQITNDWIRAFEN